MARLPLQRLSFFSFVSHTNPKKVREQTGTAVPHQSHNQKERL